MPNTRAKTARGLDPTIQNLTSTGPTHDHRSLDVTSTFIDKSYNFFKLPAEIRSIVYDCLINISDAERAEAMQPVTFTAPTPVVLIIGTRNLVKFALSAALAATCKLIYEEFMPVIYCSATIIVQKDKQVAQISSTIGDFASSLVRHIIIKGGARPKHVIMQAKQRNDQGAGIKIHRFPGDLPNFTNLKTVTIYYDWDGGSIPLNGSTAPVEDFLLRIARSKPQEKLFPHNLMSSIKGGSDIVWRLDMRSQHIAPGTLPYSMILCLFKIDVIVSIQEVEKDGFVTKEWDIRNALEDADGDDIRVWCYGRNPSKMPIGSPRLYAKIIL